MGRLCVKHCEALAVRRASLAAQLDALAVEAAEARRREQQADHTAAEHAQLQNREALARTDPVTARAATQLNLPRDTLDLLIALTFGWLLEAVACLGWLLALLPARDASHAFEASVTESNDWSGTSHHPVTTAPEPSGPPGLDVIGGRVIILAGHVTGADSSGASLRDVVTHAPNAELLQLTSAITDGRVRPTVKEIRRFLQCSPDNATRLRRQFLEVAGHTSPVTPS
ncbi:hypothetical protein [Burkholderia diffusa]|uniref:hypothetical protein n=1 Tax=Burkholderia diffusa TaxID=488732 RepID=UPI00157A5472|nr:hypothetical protein [Burkholderia diffusa]NTY41723.1 hypothetical protein [Burkholderia diffusa]